MAEVKGITEEKWEDIFSDYDIVKKIREQGRFVIGAIQIKKYREPRLMAKFDHSINLPKIFSDNKLVILPVSRGAYEILPAKAYHAFEKTDSGILHMCVPEHLQSLDGDSVPSEAIALNCAFASGIMAHFLEDSALYSTVSGRMGSGRFSFQIDSSLPCASPHDVIVHDSQIEIDAAYEGVSSLALFEAKKDLSDDFIVRQLYYPYRTWADRVAKPVRPVFMVYSNGIYHLYEYAFESPNNYSSIYLRKQQRYTLENTSLTADDLNRVCENVRITAEPEISFPQADSFARVVNLCEILFAKHFLSRSDVTGQYAFDTRQTDYYTAAARYLGLVEKKITPTDIGYVLTKRGQEIQSLPYKRRQLAYCAAILSHRVFYNAMKLYLIYLQMPNRATIVSIMKTCELYNVKSDSTYERRASTVASWLNWMVGLINT